MSDTDDRPMHPLVEEDFNQACNDMQSIWKAWQDRFDITDQQASSLLLLFGTSLQQQGGRSLEEILEYVKAAYMTSAGDS